MRRATSGRGLGRLVALVVGAMFVVVLGVWLAMPSDDDTAAGPPGAATVVEVVDGDTLVVDVSGQRENVRLLGIDTPETHHPTKPVECFGAEASARLGQLVPPGTTIRLERDVEARDHYDRLLAYVMLPGTDGADGGDIFVNAAMVGDGYAVVLEIDPNRAHRSELASLERDARAVGAGLWGTCGGPGVAVDAVTGR